eukprot:TRINITY_DN4663_c0_g1_i5.p1 TRINITY_DN4663_c0_g1~~TRINITY_DN4663_c0_g1_i5.p1  ORF type:complete len:100 (-),score=14.55 TRINITY_DN4663_c0_g1_i5:215-514(-)
MAFGGWSNGRIFTLDPTGMINSRSSFSKSMDDIPNSIAPVCFMTAGYLSGWLEQHFGLPLVAVEVGCAALGHDCCDFIVAHPDFVEPIWNGFLVVQIDQ